MVRIISISSLSLVLRSAHRSRACPTSAIKKCRNRQQPISMRALRRMAASNRNRLLPISAIFVPKSGRPDFGCRASILRDARKSALLRMRSELFHALYGCRRGRHQRLETRMAETAIVSEELAKKFATERETPYTRWVRAEGLDIIGAHYVPSLHTVELKPWARRGGKGVFINHEASR